MSLPLKSLFHTLKHVVSLIQVGVYDFCHLPLVMKKPIVKEADILEGIKSAFSGKN